MQEKPSARPRWLTHPPQIILGYLPDEVEEQGAGTPIMSRLWHRLPFSGGMAAQRGFARYYMQ